MPMAGMKRVALNRKYATHILYDVRVIFTIYFAQREGVGDA
jgi:hypothetical protein